MLTDEFQSMLSWGGTPVATCGCGRVHYVASGKNMEPDGELQRLEANHKANPARYIPDPENDSVSVTEYRGVTAVWNCPCGFLERQESFLWNNRGRIIAYLQARAKRELAEAAATAGAIASISSAPP